MNPSRPYFLPVAILALLLAAPLPGFATTDGVDPVVLALRELDQSVARGQLAQAESQLQALQQQIPGDTRLEAAQRQIAAGYLQQGESALSKGDLNAAKTAVQKVRTIGPSAAAQSATLANAVEQAERQQQAAAAARQAAEAQAKAKAEAARAEQVRQQRLAAERKAAAEQQAAAAAKAQAAAEPAAPVAQLIDPALASSSVALPMLDSKDNDSLRALLDKVAADVVAFRCAVHIEVRQSKDYPWVAALLTARVKKLDPAFELQLSQQIDPAKAPQLVLTPQP